MAILREVKNEVVLNEVLIDTHYPELPEEQIEELRKLKGTVPPPELFARQLLSVQQSSPDISHKQVL